jgi:hypothetical protein
MTISKRNALVVFSVTAVGALALTPPAKAQLEQILKGGAIVFVIDRFGGQINNAMNKIVGDPNREAGNKTKVVPIVSVGQGVSAGAAQVSGPARAVDTVKAVAQVEGNVRIGASLRLRALVPVSTKSATDIKRVYGVGVTGLIDTKL